MVPPPVATLTEAEVRDIAADVAREWAGSVGQLLDQLDAELRLYVDNEVGALADRLDTVHTKALRTLTHQHEGNRRA